MRKLIVLLCLVCCVQPLWAEMYDPTEEYPEDLVVSRNVVPEQVLDMVTDPVLADEKYALATRKSVTEATWKAVLLPGWGHWYLEHYNKFGIIVGAEAIILIGIVNSDTEKYVNAKPEIRDAVYQQREALGMLGGLIWLWSVYDAVGLALENNRLIDEEEKKLSLQYGDDLRLSWREVW